MKTLLLLMFLATPLLAEQSITIGGFSQHLEGRGDQNQTHNTVGWDNGEYFFYSYKNSDNRQSYLGGWINRNLYNINKNWSIGHLYGAIRGYKFEREGGWFPAWMPMLSYQSRSGLNFDILCPIVVCELQFRLTGDTFDTIGIRPPWESNGYIQAGVSNLDPDLRAGWGYGHGQGWTTTAKIYWDDEYYSRISYSSTNVNVEPERGDNIEHPFWYGAEPSRVHDTAFVTLGREWPYSDSTTLTALISVNSMRIEQRYFIKDTITLVEVPVSRFTGFGLAVGATYQFTDKSTGYMEFGVSDDIITDYKLLAEYSYKITDNLEYVISLTDWDKKDFTEYKAELRWGF